MKLKVKIEYETAYRNDRKMYNQFNICDDLLKLLALEI